jgi:hypothetical protein
MRDALLYSVSANSAHGLPRTNADKRKAVALLLADSEWSRWSDREIGRHCQVNNKVVGRMRRKLSEAEPQMRERKVRRGGTVYEMTVAGATGASDHPAIATASKPLTDALGIPVPPQRGQVFASSADFQEAYDLFARLGKIVDRIGRSPAGEVYRKELVGGVENGQSVLCCPAVRIALRKLQEAEPYCGYCPECERRRPGSADPRCRRCAGRGWTTRPAFEASPDSVRLGIKRQAS